MRSTARAVVALLALSALSLGLMGVSGAQEGPAIELDPASIPEAATVDVTVNGSGFSIDVFVLNCPGAGGSIDALVEGDVTLLCDLGNLLTGSPDADGNFSVTFTGLDVTDCGLVFVAGDLDQTEVGGPEVLTVDNPADDVECEVVEGASYEDVGAEEEELADTGNEALPLALIAVGTVVFGLLVSVEARRLLRAGRS